MTFKSIAFLLLLGMAEVFAQNESDNIEQVLKDYAKTSAEKRIVLLNNLLTQKAKEPDSTKARIAKELAFSYREINDFKKATFFAQQNVDYSRKYSKEQPEKYANALYYLAYFYYYTLRYTDAANLYETAIQYQPNAITKAYYYQIIANIQENLGDYAQQDISLKQAIYLLKDPSKDYLTAADIYNAVGGRDFFTENPTQGISHLTLAEKYYWAYTKSGGQDENLLANIYVNLGNCYKALKKTTSAETYYSKAQKLLTKMGQTEQVLFKVNNNLLVLYTEGKDVAKAQLCSRQTQQLLEKANLAEKSLTKTYIYYNIGYLHLQLKQYQESLVFLKKSIQAFPLLNLQNKQPFDVIRDKRTLLLILRDFAVAYQALYQQHHQPQNLQAALQYYAYADALIDVMRQEHTGKESKLFWRNKAHPIYEKAIEACYLSNDADKAFAYFEKSRAVILLDELRENEARQHLSNEDLKKEKSFRQQLVELQLQLEQQTEQSADFKLIMDKITLLKSDQSQFNKTLEKRNTTYHELKYENKNVTLAEVQQYLRNNKQTLVEYFVGDSSLFALVVMPAQTKIHKITYKDYVADARDFMSYCSDYEKLNNHFNDFLQLSFQIYQQSFQLLHIPQGRVVISTDSYVIPFDVLSTSAKKADYLVKTYAISYTYSANTLLRTLAKEPNLVSQVFTPNHPFLGIAPAKFNTLWQLNDLNQSVSSLNKITDIWSGKALVGEAATKKAFQEEFSKHQIVQIYSHADADSSGKEPRFYLSDAVLRVSELNTDLAIQTQLVVLSACKTGIGRKVTGEGIFSLARGFATLGIPSTITTLWSVDEKSTYQLTELFHQNLSQGLPKDEALQQAKMAFLSEADNEHQLPVFWAATTIIGETSPIHINHTKWLLIGVFGLFMAIILVLRKSIFRKSKALKSSV